MSHRDEFEIDVDACRMRQQRLVEYLCTQDLSAAVITQRENVQWLTGLHLPWLFAVAARLDADGRLTLAAPRKTAEKAAADEVAYYDAKHHSTLRNDQLAAACQALEAATGVSKLTSLGVEKSAAPGYFGLDADAMLDIEPMLYRLRRRKMPDELRMMKKAISATEKMYERARAIIEPGVGEIQVFNELQAVAVEEFGEPLTRTGNDYQCGSRGGPPRANRQAQAGELYILDLGPAFRGYFADNARTIAVTEADEQQLKAWSHIQEVFAFIESSVRPGVSAARTFAKVQAMLDQAPLGVFNHHLGHGVGLFPHEAPHLNPNWDDTFELGDVFTAEPGLYAPELAAGMRLENDYLVTESGVECLTNFTMEL